jgi:hypothetical protein
MPNGLPVSRIVSAAVLLNPAAAALANLSSLLILGDSDIIDTQTRMVSYGTIEEVSAAFGANAEEYKAALLWFSQSPRPNQLFIGKWARTATSGRVIGKALTAGEQALANFTGINNGALKFAIDGAGAITVSALNFAACANMNAVAAVVNAALVALPAAATCTWDGAHFALKSTSTGAASTIAYPVAPAAGTDMKALLGLTAALGARKVDGIAAESTLAAVQAIDALPQRFYGLQVAYSALADADHLAVAAHVEASARPHLYGLTTAQATAIDGASQADIGYQLKALGYQRTFCQYSSSSAYAAASMFARILTTDFNANNSTITLMFKQEPGVVAESLTTAQADALDAKRYNYFANFENETAIIVNGMCVGDAFIDEIVGLDWLTNRIETDVYNLLYTSGTKIPQTDAGNHQIGNVIAAACEAGVNNGLLGSGTWTGDGFGQLKTGDFLAKGYYVFIPPLSSQSPADRQARKSVAIQVGAKLAGAVHSADLTINVNR